MAHQRHMALPGYTDAKKNSGCGLSRLDAVARRSIVAPMGINFPMQLAAAWRIAHTDSITGLKRLRTAALCLHRQATGHVEALPEVQP
jgi:hypothetical protein